MTRVPPRALLAGTVASALLAGNTARAAEPAPATAHFAWHDPARAPSCIPLSSLRDAVAQVLGRPLEDDPSKAESRATVSFEPAAGGGWDVRIRKLSRDGATEGERTLHGDGSDCAELLGPASLVIAMVIDRPARPAVLQAPRTPPARASRWSGRASAGVRAAYGMLPGLAGALAASADVAAPGWVPMRWTLLVWPGSEERTGLVGGSFRAWTAGLSACPTITGGASWRLDTCAGVALGTLSATGLGLSPSREPSHFWGHLELTVEARYKLAGPFGVRIAAGAMGPWNRPGFVYDGADGASHAVHRPWSVSPIVDAALEIDFGP